MLRPTVAPHRFDEPDILVHVPVVAFDFYRAQEHDECLYRKCGHYAAILLVTATQCCRTPRQYVSL